MTEQIIINGVRMDTLAGKGASLIFQSPYFTDLDSIVSNRSTSVELPATPNNLRAVGRADLPGLGTLGGEAPFEYRRHRVDYYLDGIRIFTGDALLLSLTPTALKFSFVWGNVSVFQKLVDFNLRDLQTEDAGDYVGYDDYHAQTAKTYYPDYWQSRAHWREYVEGTEQDRTTSIQPMMPVSMIMARIKRHFGVSFEFPGNSSFDSYRIPLLSRCADDYSRAKRGTVLNCMEDGVQQVRLGSSFVDIRTTIKIVGGVKPGYDNLYDKNNRIIDVGNIDLLGVWVMPGFSFTSDKSSDCLYIAAASIADSAFWYRPLAAVDGEIVSQASGGGRYLHTYKEGARLNIDLADSDYNRLTGVIVYYSSENAVEAMGHEGFGTPFVETARIAVFDAGLEELPFAEGTIMPLYRNLPDWSVGDLLKNLMKLEGLFAYALDASTIRFVSIGQLYDNRPQAYDWTDRLVLTSGAPAETSSSFGSFARRNWFRYAEDETVEVDYDAFFDIDNQTLDAETDLVATDFAPTQGSVIPVWQYDGEEWSFEEVEPRILQARTGSNGESVSFDGLAWQNILRTKYSSYTNLVGRPRLVKASVLLSALELCNLDFTRPVYARQWGHYYAINKLTTKSDGKADVELLRLGDASYYEVSAVPGHEGFEEDVPASGYRIVLMSHSDGDYYITVPEASEEEYRQLVESPDYRLCLVRYGYTRRGKNGKKWDRHVKAMIGTHTDRQRFRAFRQKLTWRIIGHEILQRGSLSVHSQMARSPLYKDATLVFDLGQPIRLPRVRATGLYRTYAGRIRNRSRDGLMELYVGLYRKMTQVTTENARTYESWGWELVSNLVQVRGRNATNTKYWEFDKSNELEV